jgi:hypothetical protein
MALLSTLREWHEVIPLSEPTRNSKAVGFRKEACPVDLLIIEFAGMNMTFYGDEWQETCDIIQQHDGPVIFITDDPDLTFPWAMLPHENYSRWTIAVNAVHLEEARAVLKAPLAATMVDTPYASLLTPSFLAPDDNPNAIYYGRPGGRTKQIRAFLPDDRITVAGKPNEWESFGINPTATPEQRYRPDWYRQWRACLALYDNKHARTGWRTGRAYHALNAGIPVAAPEGNDGLAWCYTTNNSQDLHKLLNADRPERERIHTLQLHLANPPFPYKIFGI